MDGVRPGRTAASSNGCSVAHRELRPADLGELLDRAVTLCARNAGVMLGAVGVPYVPYALLQWALLGDRHIPDPSLPGGGWPAIGIIDVAGALMFLFARGAAARVAYERYAGRPIVLAAAFRTGFARFGALLGMSVVATLCVVPLMLVLTVTLRVVGGIVAAFGASTFVAGTTGLVAAFVLVVPASLWLLFAYHLATVRVALGAPPSTAVLAALRVTAFRRPWRSLLAAAVTAVIWLAIPVILVLAAAVIPVAAVRVFVQQIVVNVVSIVAEVLAVAFFVAYDVDLAVRHEGFDLAHELNEPAPR